MPSKQVETYEYNIYTYIYTFGKTLDFVGVEGVEGVLGVLLLLLGSFDTSFTLLFEVLLLFH